MGWDNYNDEYLIEFTESELRERDRQVKEEGYEEGVAKTVDAFISESKRLKTFYGFKDMTSFVISCTKNIAKRIKKSGIEEELMKVTKTSKGYTAYVKSPGLPTEYCVKSFKTLEEAIRFTQEVAISDE